MSTAISGRIALLRLSTSTPDMSERERSTSATSKAEARTCAMASSPVRASPATSMSTRPEKTCFSPILTTSWSSTISSRIIVRFPAGWVQVLITARCPGLGPWSRTDLHVGQILLPPLERVAEDDSIPLHRNVFRLHSGKVRHEFPDRLEDDVARLGVVTKVAVRGARGSALRLRHVALRGREMQLGLGRRRDEGRRTVRHGGHQRSLGL